MSDDSIWVCYHTDAVPEDIVSQIRPRGQAIGFTISSHPDDSADQITLEYDDVTDVNIRFNRGDNWDWSEPRILLTFSTMSLDTNVQVNQNKRTRSLVQDRVEAILGLIEEIVLVTQPEYVWSMLNVGPEPDNGLRASERPIAKSIPRKFWVTVFSKSTVGELGGRERVLEAPAWMVKELDSGHVMVVKTDNPVDPTTRPSVSTDSYLLEGKSREVLEEDQQDIADPFLHLDNGALGTDVVIHRENVEGNLTNDDIQLVRVKVEEDALWELDSGEFLRRRIDHQGDPIGDLPDKIGVDEEPYPPLIRLNVPPEFVELDAPTDENVVTKVLEMDIEISKLKILANLAGAVSDAEDLAAIEPLVDQLHKLDDVSGIEQVIEERIL